MTTRQNTNNPCPSNALADLNDNTIIIDEWVNSKNDYTTDRFGNQLQTKHKILSDLKNLVDKTQSGSFLPILNHIQVVEDESGGRTDISSSNQQSCFSVRDDGLCGVWNSPQRRWQFLFDGDGNLIIGNVCYNQDWYNLTSERQQGVMYTNTTGKPIMVSISCLSGSLWISNGVEVARASGSGNISAIVPNGVAYAFGGEIVLWSELR